MVSYLNRYLELVPDDLDAMEIKSRVLFDTARDEYQAKEALKVHVQMIAVKPKESRAGRRPGGGWSGST